jgi:hypothetical protein
VTVPTLTRDQAGTAVKAAVAERDAIQANLLELDSSFGKQLLAGAELTGDTKRRWDATAATLATLWQVYSAYSAVVDQAAEVVARHLGPRELAAITALLTGRSVQLASGPAPLSGRDLADPGREELTLATAMARMRGAFAAVTEVVSAAEQVWTEVAGRLDAVGAELARVTPQAATLGDEALAGSLAAAQGTLTRLRDTLNSDPLALWLGGHGTAGSPDVDTSAADQLQERVAAAVARIDELVRLRDDSHRRIAGVTAAAAAARSAREDAVAAWRQASEKIAAGALPPEPADLADLSARLASLGALLADGRWARLASELDLLDRELATATARFKEAERAVVAAVGKRDELRGLLGAYKAKAGRLGAVEDPGLIERYDRARDLLWTAPCDLTAAQAAVAGYQQAVLGVQPR